MSNFEGMGKGALRQAMRDANLPYAGLNVEGMRAALLAHTAQIVPVAEDAPVVQETDPAFDNACTAVVDAAAAHIASEELAVTTHTDPEPAPVVQEPATPEVAAPVVQLPRATSKGLKIEPNRPMQNGVRMPSAGGLCRAVWDWCGAQPVPPTAKEVRAQAELVGWNTNNASIEFYNWRKFNGISGRKVA